MAGSLAKVALITGTTGQDGAYLSEFLLSKGYVVHGMKRRSSSFNTERLDHLIHDPHEEGVSFHLHYGDVTDATNIIRIVQETQPDEIYNLAAQSHVQVSFETPEYTANADGLGTLRLLEAIRILGRKALCLLDHGQLPRSLWHARVERHFVQSRESDPRRNVRNPQDHARGRLDRTWATAEALPRRSQCRARLGTCARLCGGDVDDAAAGRARRLRARDRRGPFGARIR